MKKKNLKSLKLNKQAISGFNHKEIKGGKVIRPTRDLSCYAEDCPTVQSLHDYTCGNESYMYGSCNAACDTFNYTDFVC